MSTIKNENTCSIFNYISGQVDGKDVMEIDDNGTISFTGGESAYGKALSDRGLTVEQVKTVQEVNSSFITAATEAAGNLAVDYMRENDNAESAVLEFQMGHDTHTVNYSRGGEITNIHQSRAVGDNGDLMAVKTRLANLFSEIDAEEDAA